MKTIIFSFALLIAISVCFAEESVYYPVGDWRTSTPEAQGIDSRGIIVTLDAIHQAGLPVHSLLLVRHGWLVLDAYFYPFKQGYNHDVASVTKSFTSTAVGIAIDKGLIKGTDESLLSFFPDAKPMNMNARKRSICLEDLLTMRAGFRNSHDDTLVQLISSPDYCKFCLDLPMSDQPGSKFNYTSCASHLLSCIVSHTTGISEHDFLQQNLFTPLSITHFAMPADPQGVTIGWGDLHLLPTDMAKFGYLFLHNGKWGDQQLVSENWVKEATAMHVQLTPDSSAGYGYQWWIDGNAGCFGAMGRNGQRILVFPVLDAVVVVTAGTTEEQGQQVSTILMEKLRPAVQLEGSLPENPVAQKQLAALLNTMTQPPMITTTPKPLSSLAAQVSGKTYRFAQNATGLLSFRLDFSNAQQGRVVLELADRTLDLPVGLAGEYCITEPADGALPEHSYLDPPLALKGEWESQDAFILNINEVSNIHELMIRIVFAADKAKVTISDALLDWLHYELGARVE